MDFIGPLPSAKGGYRYCLVIIDKFSKWVEAIPTRNNSANTVARVVANQILPLWGAPIQIESDQGTHFTGQVMKQICQMLNIKQSFHIPYRPQSSGMVERANRTPRWHGPYEVKAICNSCVATTVKGKLRWYHMSQCKSFKSTQNK